MYIYTISCGVLSMKKTLIQQHYAYDCDQSLLDQCYQKAKKVYDDLVDLLNPVYNLYMSQR